MPRTTTIANDRVESSIYAAEKDGPLPTLGALWEKAATIYNTELPFGMSKVTPSALMLKAKSLSIQFRTKAGKAGGDPANRANRKNRSGMETLCGFGDFVDRVVTVGPAIGNTMSSRPALALDLRQWILCFEKKDGGFDPFRRFYCNLNTICEVMHDCAEEKQWIKRENITDAFATIAKSLETATGIPLPEGFDPSSRTAGKMLDTTYKTSYFKHDDVFKRITKQDVVEEDDDGSEE